MLDHTIHQSEGIAMRQQPHDLLGIEQGLGDYRGGSSGGSGGRGSQISQS
ncbi:hypothetical protein SynA1825c_00843 [Synechococcus sp. A18-25c]|nr:hypothetical protein SynA1825c_00843 [Synechococcus sp. A18-25c]